MRSQLFVAAPDVATQLVRRSKALDEKPLFLLAQRGPNKESLNPIVREWLDEVIVPALVSRFLARHGPVTKDLLVVDDEVVARFHRKTVSD